MGGVQLSGKLFYRILVFYINMDLKRNKIILAAKIILFHFRRGSTLKIIHELSSS